MPPSFNAAYTIEGSSPDYVTHFWADEAKDDDCWHSEATLADTKRIALVHYLETIVEKRSA
jgi:hypothetical protein